MYFHFETLILSHIYIVNHTILTIYGGSFVSHEQNVNKNHEHVINFFFFFYFQVITDNKRSQFSIMLDALERIHAHLDGVSNYSLFLSHKLTGQVICLITCLLSLHILVFKILINYFGVFIFHSWNKVTGSQDIRI